MGSADESSTGAASLMLIEHFADLRFFPMAPRLCTVRPTERLALLNEPDRHRVAIEFPVACLDGGDDDEDSV